jgi:sugar/nucleoside kinase (ribokinase family)
MNKTFDVACIGMMAVNIPIRPVSRAAFERDVSLVDRMDISCGGDALNQAVILSRLGRKILLSGKIGKDAFGCYLCGEMRKNGVDTSAVVKDETVSTSSAAVLILEDGSRHFLSFRESNERFSIGEIDLQKIFDAKIVSIGSLLALPLWHSEELRRFIKVLKDKGCIVASDTKHDTYHVGWEGIKGSFEYLDYFFPSYDEAAYLSGKTDVKDIASFFMNAGAKNIVIKLGADGCFVADKKINKIIPAIDARTLDTTGAGDNFVAGFLSGVLYGWDIEQCSYYANTVGAISTTRIGSVAAIEDARQIEQYMKEHNYGKQYRGNI